MLLLFLCRQNIFLPVGGRLQQSQGKKSWGEGGTVNSLMATKWRLNLDKLFVVKVV